MTISTLIAKLEEVKASHGDLKILKLLSEVDGVIQLSDADPECVVAPQAWAEGTEEPQGTDRFRFVL